MLLTMIFFIFDLNVKLQVLPNIRGMTVPMGKNRLSTMVRDTCAESGISKKTNHSLRATWATTLFTDGVPEKIIQNTTGHRSLDSLHCYERVSNEQQQASSRVLTARDPNVTYDMELSSVKSKSQNTHFAQSLQTGHQLSSWVSVWVAVLLGPLM